MPIITLTSDYGYTDHYIAAVKAKLLSFNAQINIVDITHSIDKHDIAHAAFVLKNVYHEFPTGTVHLIDVSSVNTFDEHLLVQASEHFLMAPNNGVLSLILNGYSKEIYRIETSPTTFPVKDMYAEIAVKLAEGTPPERLAKPFGEFNELLNREARYTKSAINGHIIYIDGYGNLHTNIYRQEFNLLHKDRSYVVSFGREKLRKINYSYDEADGGDCFALFNVYGYLEIGINKGSAKQLLGLGYDSPVTITFQD